MGWHRRAGGASVFLLDDAAELFDGYLVVAHFNERSHYCAHHIAQKTVSSDGKHPLLNIVVDAIATAPASFGDVAVIGFYIGVQLAERGKIFIVNQVDRRLIHHLKIKTWVALPANRAKQCRLAGVGKVLIGAARSVKAGMGIITNRYYIMNGNVLRQNPGRILPR